MIGRPGLAPPRPPPTYHVVRPQCQINQRPCPTLDAGPARRNRWPWHSFFVALVFFFLSFLLRRQCATYEVLSSGTMHVMVYPRFLMTAKLALSRMIQMGTAGDTVRRKKRGVYARSP